MVRYQMQVTLRRKYNQPSGREFYGDGSDQTVPWTPVTQSTRDMSRCSARQNRVNHNVLIKRLSNLHGVGC